MWTATLIRAEKRNGRLDFEIEYLDDTDGEITRIAYSLQSATKKQVRNLARREAARLDALKSEVIDLPVGQSINIDPDVVPDPPPPTSAEIAREAWFDDWRRLNKLLRLANAGLLSMTDIRITNLQTSLQADWQNSYLDGV